VNNTAIQSALKIQPIFQSNSAAVASVARKCLVESLSKGATIIRQGGKDTDLIFILKGSVEILIRNRNHIVRKAGTHVGEMAAIDPTAKRSATVRAIEATDIARISERDFSKIADRWPNLWRQLALELANRVRDHTQKITSKNLSAQIFIGSSSESMATAGKIKSQLSKKFPKTRVWYQAVFGASETYIESLESESRRSDFALLILSPDDKVFSRGKASKAPRDNVIFELGLFMGAIGRKRTFLVSPHGEKLKLPSDLEGITRVQYTKANLRKAVSEIAAQIKKSGTK
jgi:CRP/FNR family transcriptional regulator, cyclic AMP receptor protein